MNDFFQTDLSYLDEPDIPVTKSKSGSVEIWQDTTFVLSDKRKQELRQAKLGKKLSAETKSKISQSHKTSLLAKNARANNCELARIANTGKKHSTELKQQWSLIAKQREANKVITDEQRAKMSKTSRVKDIMTPNGIFPSIAEISRQAGVATTTVRAWMKKYPNDYYVIK